MTGGLLHALSVGDEGFELLVALLVLAMGMVAIWKKIGKGNARSHDR